MSSETVLSSETVFVQLTGGANTKRKKGPISPETKRLRREVRKVKANTRAMRSKLDKLRSSRDEIQDKQRLEVNQRKADAFKRSEARLEKQTDH